MALINWSDDFSVKIKEFDDEHKKLVEMINELYDNMKVGKGKEILEEILNRLVKYTVQHFAHEEKLMNQYNYPEAKLHKAAHDNLVKQVNELKHSLDSGKTVLTINVLEFLKEWLNAHIMGTDKKYTNFLNAKGIK